MSIHKRPLIPRVRLQLMRPQPMVSEQECTRCHLTKPASDFYYVPTAAKGLKKQCKACMLVRCWLASRIAAVTLHPHAWTLLSTVFCCCGRNMHDGSEGTSW